MKTHLLAPSLVGFAALTLSGCFIVDDNLFNSLPGDGQDLGMSTMDTGPVDMGVEQNLVDLCGDPNADFLVLSGTLPELVLDTRELSNRSTDCGSLDTPGNDGFIAVDVQAGEYWHFHLVSDPRVTQDRDPVLYVLQDTGGGCSRSCGFNSDMCEGTTGDEHFAFEPDQDGRWYIGIDDRMPGGGVYILNVFRPVCGDDLAQHGESCDDTSDPLCDRNCRHVLNDTSSTEQLPNDNSQEANFLDFPASNVLTVSGALGGNNCIYPDVYAFNVPAGGARVNVRALDEALQPCTAATLTPFRFAIFNGQGDQVAAPTVDATFNCAILEDIDLAEGAYDLFVQHAPPMEPLTNQVAYRFRISLE